MFKILNKLGLKQVNMFKIIIIPKLSITFNKYYFHF